jgi:uncharacterized membrane protein SirB2
MDYELLRHTHLACVAVSYAGFFARGVGMLRGAAFVRTRWARVAPHIVDTLLLASGVSLAALARQYPWEQGWLAAKLSALVLYIALGLLALRLGRTRAVRAGAWLAAQAVFFYMVAVALTRSPFLLS